MQTRSAPRAPTAARSPPIRALATISASRRRTSIAALALPIVITEKSVREDCAVKIAELCAAALLGAVLVAPSRADACTPGESDNVSYTASASEGGSCTIYFSRMCGSAGWWISWNYGTCSFSRTRGTCNEQVSCSGTGPGGVSCRVVSRSCR